MSRAKLLRRTRYTGAPYNTTGTIKRVLVLELYIVSKNIDINMMGSMIL